jgi:hypothetical protein
MFNNTSKQTKNNATNNAVQAFLDNGGTVKRRKCNVPEVSVPCANYFTSADAPKAVDKLETWESKVLRIAAVLNEYPGAIKVVWNDGRVANSTAELYGL